MQKMWKVLEWVLVLGAALALCPSLFCVAIVSSQTRPTAGGAPDLANVFLSMVGLVVTLIGIMYAVRVYKSDALSKLHDEHGSPEHADAIRRVWTVAPKSNSYNSYTFVRQFVSELKRYSPNQADELDKARRRVTHFWYRAERLVELRLLDYADLFQSFGSPEVIEVLELLETIKAENLSKDGICTPRRWPPMELLIAWYKHKKCGHKLKGVRGEVPARRDDYERSRAERDIIQEAS